MNVLEILWQYPLRPDFTAEDVAELLRELQQNIVLYPALDPKATYTVVLQKQERATQ